MPLQRDFPGCVVKSGVECDIQSIISDLLRFKALNTVLPEAPDAATKSPLVVRGLARHVGMKRAQVCGILDLLHGGRSDAVCSISSDWVPRPLHGCIGLLAQLDPRHCPSCLKVGFHTPMWQLPWITHCPFHRESLQVIADQDFNRGRRTRSSRGKRDPARPDPIEVARHSLSEGQMHFVTRYRDFIRAARGLDPIPVTMCRRGSIGEFDTWVLQSSQYASETSPEVLQLIAVSAGVIARYLGFIDLLGSIMRMTLPDATILSFPVGTRFGQSVAPLRESLQRDPCAARCRQRMETRVRDLRHRRLKPLRAPTECSEAKEIRRFRTRVHEVLQVAVQCPSAASSFSGTIDGAESYCRLCRGLAHWHRWTKGIPFGRPDSPEAMVVHSRPRCRRLAQLKPKAASAFQSRLLANDYVEHLAAVLRRETLDGLSVVDARVQRAMRSSRELFDRFVIMRDGRRALLLVWNEPDLIKIIEEHTAGCVLTP